MNSRLCFSPPRNLIDPYAFWLTHLAQMWIAYGFALQAMVTIPTPIFCRSIDPCSCEGGGFELYEPLCAVAAAEAKGLNKTDTNASKTASRINTTQVQNEYVSLFDFLGNDTTTVLVSVGVIIIIGVTFTLARLLLGLRRATAAAQREREEAENANKARASAEAKVLELRETNLKIRKEL